MSAINETLIREVVTEVLGRLGQGNTAAAPDPAAGCGCPSNGHSGSRMGGAKQGVFQDANQACAAAHDGFMQLKKQGVAARAKVIELVKGLADANAVEWGRIE